MAKDGTNSNCITGWPNLEPMQVALYLAEEITQVKESIPWVRCASGNVFLNGGQVRNAKKSSFLQKWPIPMLVQNISRGNKILNTF